MYSRSAWLITYVFGLTQLTFVALPLHLNLRTARLRTPAYAILALMQSQQTTIFERGATTLLGGVTYISDLIVLKEADGLLAAFLRLDSHQHIYSERERLRDSTCGWASLINRRTWRARMR